MIRGYIGLAMVAVLLTPSIASAGQSGAALEEVVGTWINPQGTVKVQTAACGQNLCGWVVWASGEAIADARDSGVGRLVGTELLRDYRDIGGHRYAGKVYVPDIGRSFASTIKQVDANRLTIRGCILGGLICKSQDWRRT